MTIEDLSTGQILDILDLAGEIEKDRDAFYGLASRKIMASLFLEPSTRTRGSFESAMRRLGGDVITTADARSSSMEKGESLADTIRVWSGYSDLIVLRHPWEGAARLAAEYSDVPVINAGDGSHEHPTQTLLDLYTMRKEFGTLDRIRVALCGDLKHGRTVHSLTYALLRFGAEIIFLPGEGLDLPEHVATKVRVAYQRSLEKVSAGHLKALYGEQDSGETAGPIVDAIYMTPSQPHMTSVYADDSELHIPMGDGKPIAIYQTRWQQERQHPDGPREAAGTAYPRVTPKRLAGKPFKRAVVLHPLPRVDELSAEMDGDSRSKYFEQARNGVPVRMALIALLLGLRPWSQGAEQRGAPPTEGEPVDDPGGIRCSNPDCASQKEPQNVVPGFALSPEPRPRFICSYCERETFPAFFAYPNGEVYYPAGVFATHQARSSDFRFFMDQKSAEDVGLRKPVYAEAGV